MNGRVFPASLPAHPMSTLSIQLPDSIRAQVEELARRDGITADQFLATAAAEKVSAMRTWTSPALTASTRVA